MNSERSCGTIAVWHGTRRVWTKALKLIPEIRAEFWENVIVPGTGQELNQSLERAGRVADFLEFGELIVRDALAREESCGGHFREESQTEEKRSQA